MCRRIRKFSPNFETIGIVKCRVEELVRICVFVAKVVASGACNGANIDAEQPKWYQSTEKASIFAGARSILDSLLVASRAS